MKKIITSLSIIFLLSASVSAQHRGHVHSPQQRQYNPPVQRQYRPQPQQRYQQRRVQPKVNYRNFSVPNRQRTNPHWHQNVRNYHTKHGRPFHHGRYYQGPNHHHWSHRHFDRTRWCWLYWDRGCNSWYYWCQPHNRYYPVNYCPCQTYQFDDSQPCEIDEDTPPPDTDEGEDQP
jgi:hypothetical protein